MITSHFTVAIIEAEGADDPLTLPHGCSAQVVLRTELTAEGIDALVSSAVRVVVVDLRNTCTTQIRPTLRLLRLAVRNVRLVAVTDPGDNAAAQVSIASGAVAHVGQGLSPPALLRAVSSARRGAPCLGETGQRAIALLAREVAC